MRSSDRAAASGRVQPVTWKKDERLLYFAFQPVRKVDRSRVIGG
jgi:hypothetical protein